MRNLFNASLLTGIIFIKKKSFANKSSDFDFDRTIKHIIEYIKNKETPIEFQVINYFSSILIISGYIYL